MKYCKNADCERTGQLLPLSEFYQYPNGKYYAECRKCHSENVQEDKQVGALKAIEKLLELEIIKSSEISSAEHYIYLVIVE